MDERGGGEMERWREKQMEGKRETDEAVGERGRVQSASVLVFMVFHMVTEQVHLY